MFFTKDSNRVPGVSASAAAAQGVLYKPFKVPAIAKPTSRAQPQRKRKRVSYKNQDGGSDDESDDDSSRKKKKRKEDRDALAESENRPSLGKLVIKDFTKIVRVQFSVPTMRAKDGSVIPVVMSCNALGIRPLAQIPPRPLHDPMADHAIVLYDPTLDDRETDEERKERLLNQAKESLAKEAEENSGATKLFNPHKSLKQLLGLGDAKKKAEAIRNAKVPVVIDPIIGSKLRPHQIEGVKVRRSGLLASFSYLYLSVLIQIVDWSAGGGLLWVCHLCAIYLFHRLMHKVFTDVSWQTKWV